MSEIQVVPQTTGQFKKYGDMTNFGFILSKNNSFYFWHKGRQRANNDLVFHLTSKA